MKLHITIISFAWPPRNSIGAHRPYSWAKYWSLAGAKIRVLTARKYEYDSPLDLSLPPLSRVEVIETDYARGSASIPRRIAAGYLEKPVSWLYRKIRFKKGSPRNPREKWLTAVQPFLCELAKETDVIVSTYGPRTTHEIAALMKQASPAIYWVADYRDLWSLNHASRHSLEYQAAEEEIEKATVGSLADLITSVSETLSARQGRWLEKPWLTVNNGFDTPTGAVRIALESPLPEPRKQIRIVYTGKIYPNLRDPRPLLEELLALERERVIGKGAVAVDIYGAQVEESNNALGNAQFDHLVCLHGHVTREAALAAQRDADLLLLLESSKPDAQAVLTGKVFEYLATGVPILSLGSRRSSAIGSLLSTTRSGLCTEDKPDLIRSVILDSVRGRRPEWFRPDLAEITQYSRQSQAMKFFGEIVRRQKEHAENKYR